MSKQTLWGLPVVIDETMPVESFAVIPSPPQPQDELCWSYSVLISDRQWRDAYYDSRKWAREKIRRELFKASGATEETHTIMWDEGPLALTNGLRMTGTLYTNETFKRLEDDRWAAIERRLRQ